MLRRGRPAAPAPPRADRLRRDLRRAGSGHRPMSRSSARQARHRQPQRRQGARDPALLAPYGIEPASAPPSSDLPEPDEIGTTFVDNAELKAREAADLSRPARARRRQRPLRRRARRPARASSRPAGREDAVTGRPRLRARDQCEQRSGRELEAARARGRPRRPFRLRAGGLPGRTTASEMVRGPGRRHPRLAAARRPRLRLRPDLRARRPRPDVRRDRPGREARDQPPRRRLPQAGGSAAASERRAAGALRPLAVLRLQMPLLRLQLAMSGERSIRTSGATRCSPTLPMRPRCFPAAADLDLLRRRHALADGRRRRSQRSSAPPPALGGSPTTSRSRSRPIPPRSRPARFADLAAAGVNRVSLGLQSLRRCRRSPSLAAPMACTKGSSRSILRRRISRGSAST